MTNEELHKKFGVTADQLDKWANEYESSDWSHMRFGKVVNGRPHIADEPLDTITVKIPHSRLVAINALQKKKGITKSEFVRQAIDNELLAIG